MLSKYGKYIYFDETLEREVVLYMTSNCEDDAEVPLILMHDGQNLFSDEEAAYGRSWRLLSQIHDPAFPRCRVVGISNNQIGHGRLNEYSPFVCSDEFGIHAGFGLDVGGLGDHYLDWLVHHLIPELSQHFKFNAIYMGGSSMGGYISLAGALRYPDVFDGVFCLSNAWWFAYEPLVERIRVFEGELPKIYLDTGTHESKDVKVRRYYRDLHDSITQELRQKNHHYIRAEMIKKAIHNEAAWESRFSSIIFDLLK